jgi:hypothetical protein
MQYAKILYNVKTLLERMSNETNRVRKPSEIIPVKPNQVLSLESCLLCSVFIA